ncbi:MAG: SPW repeat protein [Patescibacteria group bacterium]|nr:SPW repeat protein [Patescibacteria group bacterium]
MYWITGILGLMFLVAPFLLGYAENFPALWTSISAGAVVLVMSGLEALRHERETWEYWVAGAMGLLAIIAPFVFGFSSHVPALSTSVLLGALIAIVAGSKIYTSQPKV